MYPLSLSITLFFQMYQPNCFNCVEYIFQFNLFLLSLKLTLVVCNPLKAVFHHHLLVLLTILFVRCYYKLRKTKGTLKSSLIHSQLITVLQNHFMLIEPNSTLYTFHPYKLWPSKYLMVALLSKFLRSYSNNESQGRLHYLYVNTHYYGT